MVAVGIVRVGAEDDLDAVTQAVIVGVGVERVGAVDMDLVAVAETVVVGVGSSGRVWYTVTSSPSVRPSSSESGSSRDGAVDVDLVAVAEAVVVGVGIEHSVR